MKLKPGTLVWIPYWHKYYGTRKKCYGIVLGPATYGGKRPTGIINPKRGSVLTPFGVKKILYQDLRVWDESRGEWIKAEGVG